MSDKTYRLLDNGQRIWCLVCGLVSHSPGDVHQRYCGHCHLFHQDLMADTPLPDILSIDPATVPSAVLQRLIAEVQQEPHPGSPHVYDRVHNRHNRGPYPSRPPPYPRPPPYRDPPPEDPPLGPPPTPQEEGPADPAPTQ